MLQRLRDLAEAFFNEYNKKVEVNDMSLPRGGLFDHKGNWETPHRTHRLGLNADIQTRRMSETERTYFEAKGEELGFDMLYEDDPPHFHITLL
jgi:murein endopeptidase